MKPKAIKLSRLSLSDLLKHQYPKANGINANVKLKLNVLSASTIHPSASSIHMVESSKPPPYPREYSSTRAAIALLPVLPVMVYRLEHQVIPAG